MRARATSLWKTTRSPCWTRSSIPSFPADVLPSSLWRSEEDMRHLPINVVVSRMGSLTDTFQRSHACRGDTTRHETVVFGSVYDLVGTSFFLSVGNEAFASRFAHPTERKDLTERKKLVPETDRKDA